MFKNAQNKIDNSITKLAENNIIKKLNKEAISRSSICEYKFNQLVEMEIETIKDDGKKVGAGLLGGIALSVITGELF
jgi:hypothetical protein